MKRIIVIICLAMVVVFILLNGTKPASADSAITEKAIMKVESDGGIIGESTKKELFACGGKYFDITTEKKPDLVDGIIHIGSVNIENQRANAIGAAISGYAIVIGGNSGTVVETLYVTDSREIIIPIGNIDAKLENFSIAGIAIPTFKFLLANGFRGFDPRKALSAFGNWKPNFYSRGQTFRMNWQGKVSNSPKWGVWDNKTGNLCLKLRLIKINSDQTKTTFWIEEVLIPVNTIVDKTVNYITN